MNLFWKRQLGLLKPTARYEKLEIDFLTSSEKLKTLQFSAALSAYKKLLSEYNLVSKQAKKKHSRQLAALKKHPDVAFYLKNVTNKNKPNRPAYLTFSDDFYRKESEKSPWNSGFFFKSEQLAQHYSFYNEKQANNAGSNTTIGNSVLQIQTRREATKALAWHPTQGFSEKHFAYTSDVIQSTQSFKQERGIFKAKLRCSGKIHHAFWLASEKKDPHINVFHFDGSGIRMGYVNNGEGEEISIKGIDPSQYYIYTLEWTAHELNWYINNVLVFSVSKNIPTLPLSMTFNSFIPEDEVGDEGLLEVDWVRVYQWM
jgi:beta-glucanase (GH16 family)